jgi:hypothetical protein
LVTPLRKGVIGLGIRVRGGFERFLSGVGRAFRRKGEEAGQEIGELERPAPKTEAEEALHQAMGWADDEVEDAMAVSRRKVREALES